MKQKGRHRKRRRQVAKRAVAKHSHKRSEFEKITDLTVNLATVTVATSAGLAIMKGSKEALKR